MKSVFRVFLFAAVLVAIAHSYPGTTRDSSESSQDDQQKEGGVGTVLVLPGRKNPFVGSVFEDPDLEDDTLDTFQSPGFYVPFSINPFNGFLTGMMKRLREQMSSILSRIPESGIVSPWGKIPEGANTTSTTKVVDGHVITINETTYSSGNDSHGAVFRVRIIDVKPQNDTSETVGAEIEPEAVTTESSESETTTGPTEDSSTPARSVETVENDLNNEIPKSQIELLNA